MSERVWTPSQKDAIEADTGSLLVSAAAGSGKTAVLVERIVRLLTKVEPPVAPSELLVVTFTNAAAAEMRSRIYTAISGLMRGSNGEKRAQLAAILPRLDEMNVCTMDAFGIKLVRENFHACGVQSDFTILDNGESDILKKETAADTVESVFAEFPEKAASLAKLFQKGRTDDKLIEAVTDLSDFSMSEPDPDGWLDGVTAYFTENSPNESVWGKIIADEVYEGLCEMKNLARRSIEELEGVPSLYSYGSVKDIFNSLYSITENAVNKFMSVPWDEKIKILSVSHESIKELPSFTAPRGMSKDPVKLACAARRKTVSDFFEKTAPKLMCTDEAGHRDDVRRLKPDAELLILTVKRFNEELLRRKKEMNKYDFADILHFALDILCDKKTHGKTPTAEYLSEQLHEILIDEYQDTNRAQDMLFSCLSKDGKNLFTVGDVKQSIYRFRLASPEIFIEKSETYPPYDGKSDCSKIVLKNNFRSKKGVLAAINYMFDFVMSKKCGEIDYNDDERLCPPPGTENVPIDPDFEMHIIDKDGKIEGEAAYTASLIESLVSSGAAVKDKEGNLRKAGYGDFCILLRSAKNRSSVFSQALRRRNIPVSVEAKDGFFETAEIRLAVSLLHIIDNPLNDVSLLAVMLSPLFGFTPEDAARVRIDTEDALAPETGLWARVCLLAENGDEMCIRLKTVTDRLRRVSSLENAGQAVRSAFDETEIIPVMGALSDGELRRANLRRLMSMAESYSVDSSRTLGAFVRYLDALAANDASVKRASGSDGGSVRIMTMHGSKGLEFPFVIISGFPSKFNDTDTKDTLVTEHSLGVGLKIREPELVKSYDTLSSTAVKILKKRANRSEELRILYVAMTRARDKLFVVASADTEKMSELNALSPSASPVSPYLIKNAKNPFSWFVYAYMHHPDAYCLRKGEIETKAADFPAVFKTVSLPDETENGAAAEISAEPDREITAGLCDRMRLAYAYLPAAGALSKHTASTLKAERFSPEFFGDKMPSFLGKGGVTPTEIGTATHLFLQYCDFDAAKTDICAERERLVVSGRLSREQADSIDTQAIESFVNSPLADEIKNADAVYREKRFTIAESICALDPSLPHEFSGEKTVIIGKIDLCFVKDGAAVIVDYKTDTVTDENVLVNRYREQLSLYVRAAEKILGCRAQRCVLYSLKGRKSIDVPRYALDEFGE